MKELYRKYQKLIKADKNFSRSYVNVQFCEQQATDIIKDKISHDKPLMIARFGANELNVILNYIYINKGFFANFSNLITGIPFFFKYKKGVVSNFFDVAGFFPATKDNLDRFAELSLEDLPCIDVLGSWQSHEKFLFHLMSPHIVRVRISDLSPVTNPVHPWTVALQGKKVLVVHPFEETIRQQYNKRQLLFKNNDLLPEFELKTLKAVQSVAGNGSDTGFKDWFDALDYMKEKISNVDFDIAIIGCGAYGMPLAAHVKRMGKQSFHLGGETQIMFGIKGKRWEQPSYNYQELFYNEHWTRPLQADIPKDINKVEGGCYW